ncbi:MAG: hypothetical protein ABI616_01465 [Pseudomonadota bacterium]
MKRISNIAALLWLIWISLSQAAAAATFPDQDDSLDEVVVKGTRSHQLDLIRNEMVRIEDKFNERYNQLNANHDFDTHCYIEARVSTRTKRRYCRAVYQEKALEREGQDHAEAMKVMINGLGPNGPAPWVPPAPATIVIEAHRKEYQQNIRDVVRKNPELVEMLRQRYELGKRYDATRHKIFGSKAEQEDQPELTMPLLP